jgi:drug/metabolite transporter (DMT)-like permease
MPFTGELIALGVAMIWTVTALFAEVASKHIGSMGVNVSRMILSLFFLSVTLWFSTGTPYPSHTDGDTWLWLGLSGLVGYTFGDYFLFKSYILVGSKFGQLFMTLSAPSAALAGWSLLGQRMSLFAILGMVVTLTGISISILGRNTNDSTHSHHRLHFQLPAYGILCGVLAGIGQGVGLVLSGKGMESYVANIPEGEEAVRSMVPFASTFIRAVFGAVSFLTLMAIRKDFGSLRRLLHDRTAIISTLGATITGPFIGVSLSLMAVSYTAAGIAQTLMALTPVFILLPASLLFGQKVTLKEVIGAVIAVGGVALFFI